MKILRKYVKSYVIIITKINLLISKGTGTILLVFGGIMLYEAIARHFFNSPTTWAYELSKMLFGFYMIWGGAYTLLCREHISMDLFYSKWPPRTKAIMDSITFIFVVIFFSVLTYFVTKDALQSISFNETSNSTLDQPLYHWRTSLVIGVLLLFLQGIAYFLKNIWFAIYQEEL